MRYRSTRSDPARAAVHEVGFGAALLQGLAPDGGLFVPVRWPQLAVSEFTAADADGAHLAGTGARFLFPFLEGDALSGELPAVTREAFDFPAPLVHLDAGGRLAVLELFHGPTAAFKDFGARFLAACLRRLRSGADKPLTILVATSGDTGGAVAAAFHGQPGVRVAVLFPKGLVSPTQERQLTCWGGNVQSFAVRGTFDDCQRLVKQAFLDPELAARTGMTSANSINLGRLLPQAVYYAATSLAVWQRHGAPASFVIPSGNLGNAAACIWARQCGLPIDSIVLAHNANRTVPDYLDSGVWAPRASVATLASAMDVGNPSNMERLQALYPQLEALRGAVSAVSVTDAEIRARICAGAADFGQLWCPHTATAAEAWSRLPAARRAAGRWVLVATAHPAKFREIVEPLLGRSVPVPESLARLFARPTACTEIGPQLPELAAHLSGQELWTS